MITLQSAPNPCLQWALLPSSHLLKLPHSMTRSDSFKPSRTSQRSLDLVGRGNQLIGLTHRELLTRLGLDLLDERIKLVAGSRVISGIDLTHNVTKELHRLLEA